MKKKKKDVYYFSNKEIAHLLRAISAAYLVKGESQFKVMAYDRAATAIEHATVEVKDLWDEGKLATIPGVGGSIAQHLDELFRKGKSSHFEKILKGLPPAMFQLIKIAGIGPKTAFRLCRELKIWKAERAVERLKKAAEQGKIRSLAGFGPESERKILEAITQATLKKKEKQRLLLYQADELAQEIITYLKQSVQVLEAVPLGSLRRRCATVGDIDIAVKTRSPKEVIEHFLGFPKITKIISQGEKKVSVLLRNGLQVDLRVQSPLGWGSMLQYFTGSKHHNIHLREIALKKGFSLSEYGIKQLKRKKIIKTATEEEFYHLLGMEWIPPEMREDQGEIELAQKKKLPSLIKQKDIKGDLQLHSNFPVEPSHDLGADDFITMIKQAHSLGYSYLAFTEHNPSFSQHTSSQILSILLRKKEEVDKVFYTCAKKLNIEILNGLEVDIRPDGSLALPEKAAKTLDFIIASVHTSFKMSRQKMTKRILTALSHPKVKILGHPTGRIINQREGYELDWEKIFAFCLKEKKVLEINAFPNRLDLPDFLIREAVKAGVKLIINTDSHQVEQMELIRYGVDLARRGWAQRKDIVNSWSFKKLIAFLEIDYQRGKR